MIYLLDVSALLGLGYDGHEFHARILRWVQGYGKGSVPKLATCAITELGFVRILSQLPEADVSIEEACDFMRRLKEGYSVRMFSDDHGVHRLPKWVKTARQTTDGHLVELAKAHSAVLATFDEKIAGAFVIS